MDTPRCTASERNVLAIQHTHTLKISLQFALVCLILQTSPVIAVYVTSALVFEAALSAPCSHIVCMYQNSAQIVRKKEGIFKPADILPQLCTHILYEYAKLDGTKIVPSRSFDLPMGTDIGNYAKVTNFKNQYPHIKVLITVGSYIVPSADFHRAADTRESRKEFITSAIEFIKSHKFDGLNVDWQYPGIKSPVSDKQKYTLLLKELRQAFDKQSKDQPRLLLTASVNPVQHIMNAAYEIPAISRYVDWLHLMTYSYYGRWSKVIGHNSPLYSANIGRGIYGQFSVSWGALYYAQKKVPRDKIVIGLPFYGRSFTVKTSTPKVGDPATVGMSGPQTNRPSFLAYYEICQLISNGATVKHLSEQKVPYLVYRNQWVGYDDVKSLRDKIRFVKSQGFGGVHVSALDLDDFRGTFCKNGSYPLLHSVNAECNRN